MTTAPFEVLYLKLFDVTQPPAPVASTVSPPYSTCLTFPVSWTPVVDDEAGVSGYRVHVIGYVLPTVQQFTVAAPATQ